jgi:hypothetical protein
MPALVIPPASGHVSAHTEMQSWSQACVGFEFDASVGTYTRQQSCVPLQMMPPHWTPSP